MMEIDGGGRAFFIPLMPISVPISAITCHPVELVVGNISHGLLAHRALIGVPVCFCGGRTMQEEGSI